MSGYKHDRRDERGRFTKAGGDGAGPERTVRKPRRPQIIRHQKALTGKEIDIFLSTLAETCNVALSARQAKRKANTFYALKRRDSEFRAAWLEALSAGYDHLEMELLNRARFGALKEVFYRGLKTGTTRTFSDAVALRLLEIHRKAVQPGRSADQEGKRDAKAIFDELAARIEEMEAEELAKKAGKGGGGGPA